MSDEKNMNEENVERERKRPFLKETFKDEQFSGKRIWQAVCKTIGKGLVFGVAACLAFCAVKPWMESQFNQETKVSIPKDEVEEQTEVVEEAQEEKEEQPKLTAENYREMNKALNEVAVKARNCIVEIEIPAEKGDWKDEASAEKSISGVIVWDNGSNLLLLAPYREFLKDSVLVKFSNNKESKASLMCKDSNLNFAIYVVQKSNLNNATLKKIQVAQLGNSYVLGKGDPVIAMGMQFGYSDGMGYGVISSVKNFILLADYKYQIITTDIAAASQGSGVLLNIDGEVVGIIDQKHTDITGVNLVSAYAVSEIKGVIELLSNGASVPYLGVIGIEVTEKISEEEGIPQGIYVKEVEAESPAMEAGIQCGDIIIKVGDTEITSQDGYSNKLLEYSVGNIVKVQVMRQGSEEYEKIELDAVVGMKE